MIRVGIFEDNVHLLKTLQMLFDLTEDIRCVGAWVNADHAVKNLKNIECDVILMDIEMPGLNGLEACRLIKDAYPNINVVIQSIFEGDEYIFEALCNGASGYILKNVNPEKYLEVVREVNAGGSPMSPGIARKVIDSFKRTAVKEDYKLTGQEKKILGYLVEGKSYKMIASSMFVSIQTVKTHIRNIYTKLQVHSGTEAVALALREKLLIF